MARRQGARRERLGGTKQHGTSSQNGATLGFEQKLWADKLRGHMDAAEYKHVVLGLIFLKYISDAFQERYEALKADRYPDPEEPGDEYTRANPHSEATINRSRPPRRDENCFSTKDVRLVSLSSGPARGRRVARPLPRLAPCSENGTVRA